jgi:hypothetical protein
LDGIGKVLEVLPLIRSDLGGLVTKDLTEKLVSRSSLNVKRMRPTEEIGNYREKTTSFMEPTPALSTLLLA